MTGLNVDFLPRSTLEGLGFRALGEEVLVHSTAVLVGCETITLGSRVRIDPYVVISASGGLAIGNNAHLAGHSSLSGRAVIDLSDFCGLCQGVWIFPSTNDYGGSSRADPTIPDTFNRWQEKA
jgi:dTDP-4-amino-4,6-dideoxy-D-glucose acyltransferase